MIEIEAQRFHGSRDAMECRDVVATNCEFDGCDLPASAVPGRPHTIRNVRLIDASQMNCAVTTAAFDEVSLHNLRRLGDAPLFLWGCVFRHVVLSGRISAIKINRKVTPDPRRAAIQPAWDAFVRDWYRDVDWALDISKAKFPGGITFEAIPGDKIRRDPATQVLIRRSRLTDSSWSQLDYQGTAINGAIHSFVTGSQFDTVVLAARTVGKLAQHDMAVLETLRNHGIAEPD